MLLRMRQDDWIGMLLCCIDLVQTSSPLKFRNHHGTTKAAGALFAGVPPHVRPLVLPGRLQSL